MSLLRLRARQRTIKNLNSILSALQVVTVLRMQRVKEKYSAVENYLQPTQEVLRGRLKKVVGPKKILVLITSNRGLCGSFNHQGIQKAAQFIRQNPGFSLVTLGKRGEDYFRQRKFPLLFSEKEIIERPSFVKAREVFANLFDEKSEIFIAYNFYVSTVVQIPKIYKFYPLPEELQSHLEPADFLLEPTPQRLMEALFYHYLEVRFFQLILDSQRGELASRLMVLKGAVDNSRELIDNLVISINKARQASITKDLAEIIGSAEALKESRR